MHGEGGRRTAGAGVKIEATLEDGTVLVWNTASAIEVNNIVQIIEGYLGPADRYIEP